jgi:two-component system, OmpR family, sensor kinase
VRPWSLRRRLVAGILALLALVFLVISLVSTVAVRRFLVERLDEQVVAAADRAFMGGPPGRGPMRSDDLFPPGQSAGTVGGRIVGDAVIVARFLDAAGTERPLSTAQARVLTTIPLDGAVHTRELGDLGPYRLLAQRLPGSSVLVTGLPLSGVVQAVWWLIGVEAVVAAAGLVLAGIAGAIIVRISLRPLQRVAATATQVAELPLANGEVDLAVRVPDADTDTRTEVGRVGAALNRMLGHIADALAIRHASETRVRQFVADASHELRTPLAAIRGYAELARRGPDTMPSDVAHALGRVESEGARMTTLVDDLLLLARLDSGRPLQRENVEFSRLVVDAVNDARAAGRLHRWRLELPGAPVTVRGDAGRLHQVIGNLLANARTHTPPGTTVTTNLSTIDGCVTVAVRDDGPGIPFSLQPVVFERFARGDSSRSRAAGSTGLGLAIVAAVVAAHHGQVEVKSRPGDTSFVVRLPADQRVWGRSTDS